MKIYIIRHAESIGNVSTEEYLKTPDHKVQLSENGILQAKKAAKILRKEMNLNNQYYAWVSPYERTRQTAKLMLPDSKKILIREDPRIREQEWGIINSLADRDQLIQQRKDVGHFFFRFPNGESGADVYDRCSHFLESVFRKTQSDTHFIFTHGLTGRILIMRILHASYEEFESWDNLENCSITKLSNESGSFKLENNLKIWK